MMQTRVVHCGVNLAPYVEELLGIPRSKLNWLHNYSYGWPMPVLTREQDSYQDWHQKFYVGWMGSALQERWINSLPNIASLVFPGLAIDEIAIQKIPCLRVHLPENVAVGIKHKDADFGHAEPEVNVWMPFTDAYGTNSVYIQDDDGRFNAIYAHPGDIAIFDAVNREHCNEVNKTGFTRVSMDFRLAPLDGMYNREAKESINTRSKIGLGDYFVTYAELLNA